MAVEASLQGRAGSQRRVADIGDAWSSASKRPLRLARLPGASRRMRPRPRRGTDRRPRWAAEGRMGHIWRPPRQYRELGWAGCGDRRL